LFDAGPSTLQYLKKSATTRSTWVILISHFHGDHFFGLPFLLLDYWVSNREEELHIVGPPGIEARIEELLTLAFPGLPELRKGYRRRYTEIDDGVDGEVEGLAFTAFEVDHMPSLRYFGYRTAVAGRTLAYSGDSVMCDGLLKVVWATVCISRRVICRVMAEASEKSTTIVSHLDDSSALGLSNVHIASDLGRFLL
jgi:ribonuclease BN (tRNA processing enzyme)